MKIALIGFRGIPVIYSGFEVFAEKLAVELVKRGHRVTVYCRGPYVRKDEKEYKGVRLVTLPTIKNKNLETFVHSLCSTTHACLFAKYDLIYYLGVGNSIFSALPRISGVKTAVNVDGLDWKREKWGLLAKLYLSFSEYLATVIPDKIVADSVFMQEYFKKKYKKETHLIAYGHFNGKVGNGVSILKRYGLEKNKYLVWVGRLVPENHPEEFISAFKKIRTNLQCVIVGDNPYDEEYKRRTYRLAVGDKRILFTGFLNRQDYAVIVKNSFAYIETKRSGGTHPSLIEAMGFGCLIVSNNHPANKEVVGQGGIYYRLNAASEDLRKTIKKAVNSQFRGKRIKFKRLAIQRAKKLFNWEEIVDDYEHLFQTLLIQSFPPHIPRSQNYWWKD